MNTIASLFDWILDTSLRASVLAVIVLLAQALLRRRLGPRLCYALWLPVLLVPFVPSLPLLPTRLPQSIDLAPLESSAIDPALKIASDSVPAKLIEVAPAYSDPGFSREECCALGWLVGVVLFGGTGLLTHLKMMRRFRRSGVEVETALLGQIRLSAVQIGVRMPEVLVSRAVESPAVAGLVRPVLLLPERFMRRFTETESALVIRHELLHLKRQDLPINVLICALQALHWFNPLLWFAAARARHDRELACDSQVLALEGDQRRREYAGALLKAEIAEPVGLSCLGLVGNLATR